MPHLFYSSTKETRWSASTVSKPPWGNNFYQEGWRQRKISACTSMQYDSIWWTKEETYVLSKEKIKETRRLSHLWGEIWRAWTRRTPGFGETQEEEGQKSSAMLPLQRHYANNCPEKKQKYKEINQVWCNNYKELGHYVSTCPQKIREELNLVTCYNCGNQGHYASNCPENMKHKIKHMKDLSLVTCFKCGNKGHYADVCPERFQQDPKQAKK